MIRTYFAYQWGQVLKTIPCQWWHVIHTMICSSDLQYCNTYHSIVYRHVRSCTMHACKLYYVYMYSMDIQWYYTGVLTCSVTMADMQVVRTMPYKCWLQNYQKIIVTHMPVVNVSARNLQGYNEPSRYLYVHMWKF